MTWAAFAEIKAEDLSAYAKFFTDVVGFFFHWLGPWPTVGLFVAVLIATYFFRRQSEESKDKHVKAALDEKERTIQRLAANERAWRAVFLHKFGKFTVEQSLLFVAEGGADPAATRTKLADFAKLLGSDKDKTAEAEKT